MCHCEHQEHLDRHRPKHQRSFIHLLPISPTWKVTRVECSEPRLEPSLPYFENIHWNIECRIINILNCSDWILRITCSGKNIECRKLHGQLLRVNIHLLWAPLWKSLWETAKLKIIFKANFLTSKYFSYTLTPIEGWIVTTSLVVWGLMIVPAAAVFY